MRIVRDNEGDKSIIGPIVGSDHHDENESDSDALAGPMLEFLHMIQCLKVCIVDRCLFTCLCLTCIQNAKRTGWLLRGINDCESIADHMYRMAIMFLVMPESKLGCGTNRQKYHVCLIWKVR